MLLVLLRLPRVIWLCFGFPVLSFRSWCYSVYLLRCAFLFCLLSHFQKGHDTPFYFHLFIFLFVIFIYLFLFLLLRLFLSVVALSTLLLVLH